MKLRGVFVSCLIGVATASLLCSCGPGPNDTRMVEFHCEESLALMNYATWEVSSTGVNGDFAVYLTGPSLFYVLEDKDDGEFEYPYLYLPEDGDRVNLRVAGDLLYANDVVVAIAAKKSKSRNFSEWIESADDAALKGVRLIAFETSAFSNEFEKICRVNPHVSAMADDPNESHTAEQSPRMTPFLFALGTSEEAPLHEAIQRLNASEVRLIFAGDAIDPLAREALKDKSMPNLHRVILCEGQETNEFPASFIQASAITVRDGAGTLNFDQATHLTELHYLTDDENKTLELERLPNPGATRVLTILDRENVTGLERLTNLEYLNPGAGSLSNDELTKLLADHPKLVCLNLTRAEIESLEPLRNAPRLEAVTLGAFAEGIAPDFTPLGALKNLRHIGVSEELESPENLEAIKKACPRAMLYAHDKFCMGSGWLLLFPPLMLAIWFVKTRREA